MSHKGYRPSLAPTWRGRKGDVIAYVTNGRRVQDTTERCSKCFAPGGPLPSSKHWRDAEGIIANLPSDGVYELYDPESHMTQIGSGRLQSRVRRRIAATHQSRFEAADCIWWLYDLLESGRTPLLRSLKVNEGETPREAEERWRETRRRGGWQVSSDV